LGLEWPAPLPPKRRVPGAAEWSSGGLTKAGKRLWVRELRGRPLPGSQVGVCGWAWLLPRGGRVSVEEDGQGAGSFRSTTWRDLWVSGATSWQSRLARGTVRRQQGRHADAAPGSAVAPVRHAVADAGIWLSRHRSQSISQL